MSVTQIQDPLPLERILQRLSANPNDFPVGVGSYFLRYLSILDYLRTKVYPYINTGLCFFSKKKGIYTDHGPMHFDEVVRYAGQLLGVFTGEEDCKNILLSPYEIYMLLVAIRVHDVGNIDGREDHEREVIFWMTRMGTVAGSDTMEKHIIAGIAEAHSGHDYEGNKEDTIGKLKDSDHLDHLEFRPRLIASLVRFADEISENRKRAGTPWEEDGTLPVESRIFHTYASSIKSVTVNYPSKLSISYFVPLLVAITPIDPKGAKRYILSEIFARLDKLNLERKYCNQYLSPQLRIDFMDIDIEILDADFKAIDNIQIPVRDVGYPNADNRLTDDPRYSSYCGKNIKNKFEAHVPQRVSPSKRRQK